LRKIGLLVLFWKIIPRYSLNRFGNDMVDSQDIPTLESHIRKCFPEIEETTVHAIATTDSMEEAGELLGILRRVRNSNHSRSDFVIVVLYAILLEALGNHIERIMEVPAFVHAIKMSKLPWNTNNSGWRLSDER
jgi:hypothetical protein